jgi:hypothetical protein
LPLAEDQADAAGRRMNGDGVARFTVGAAEQYSAVMPLSIIAAACS